MSAGHVARAIAIANALRARAEERGIDVRAVLATTSEADLLLSAAHAAVVRLPAPLAARRAGFSDLERRRLVRGTLDGVVSSFAPDLLVVDTFPSGPHGELEGLAEGTRRAIVRRHVPNERADDDVVARGLASYELAIVAADPTPLAVDLPIRAVHVPPIVIGGARLSRREARAALGLAPTGRAILVSAGGGGDPDGAARARAIADTLSRLAPDATVVLAGGVLGGAITARTAPLEPVLAAFDAAFSAAGYNTAHALAAAAVPTALFALPRPFDDQAARVARFEAASLAIALDHFDDGAIAKALARLDDARPDRLDASGAERAADALLELVGGGGP